MTITKGGFFSRHKRNINEFSDVCHFTFKNNKPTDRGSLLEPNSIGISENLF